MAGGLGFIARPHWRPRLADSLGGRGSPFFYKEWSSLSSQWVGAGWELGLINLVLG